MRFNKKENVIIIDISGSLPVIGQFPDTFEVIDDGQETTQPAADNSTADQNAEVIIQSVEKHRDYDFTLHEYSKQNMKCVDRRKMRFTFNEDQSEIQLEYTSVNFICKAKPMYFYFKCHDQLD